MVGRTRTARGNLVYITYNAGPEEETAKRRCAILGTGRLFFLSSGRSFQRTGRADPRQVQRGAGHPAKGAHAMFDRSRFFFRCAESSRALYWFFALNPDASLRLVSESPNSPLVQQPLGPEPDFF